MRPLISRTKMKAMSDKRFARIRERATVTRETLSRANYRCEGQIENVCTCRATDTHEFVSRGQGGDAYDTTNTLALCRECHDFCHSNPEIAYELGLLYSAKIAARNGESNTFPDRRIA